MNHHLRQASIVEGDICLAFVGFVILHTMNRKYTINTSGTTRHVLYVYIRQACESSLHIYTAAHEFEKEHLQRHLNMNCIISTKRYHLCPF